jgi:hypothetical protein
MKKVLAHALGDMPGANAKEAPKRAKAPNSSG